MSDTSADCHATNRLLASGDIEVADTIREAGRPERTVYSLTDQGRDRLRQWVGVLLREPDPDSALFTAALNYAGCLTPTGVATELRARHTSLALAVETAGQSLGLALPRLLLLEIEYDLVRLSAEQTWVKQLLADLDAGRLTWPAIPGDIADVEALMRDEGAP
ncbi:DNA-binding PadR family transcriptional regulator [Actinoplanes lutulentus]|uniref:PadR family transcriptional regulator n=1 Tax=Actinoplanes lutulentus TaxID=1287878 RepID=A0A327Z594_9ACTN|nr:PadR family transcriptional regulator [Actinoplanes lutulentus]MBB2949054.1 DNA-binding PadR family transcriptional regulator [Actinoplanes lutulentus]RAK31377.1 hypothetical protein B0I29_115184 [Actinoplanes lutulentus]